MQELRSRVARPLLERIRRSEECTVSSTTMELMAACDEDPVFHRVLRPLTHENETTCAKDSDAAFRFKSEANDFFRRNLFHQAVLQYSEALRFIRVIPDMHKDVAILYTNRAASFHKLGLLPEGERDCTRALSYQNSYSKAWYRRGSIRRALANHVGAMDDMKAALAHEPSIDSRYQLEKELEAVTKIAATSKRFEAEAKPCSTSREPDVKTEPYYSSDKGWGLRTTMDAQQGALVHLEEAAAAVLLKKHRKTHCHFCFRKLPADRVPCNSCAVPFYCSDDCRDKASVEHRAECGGTSWAAVLPADAVLASRLFNQGHAEDLCCHYDKLPSDDKIDLHLLSVVLATCLHKRLDRISRDELAAKLVLLISKVRCNAIGITYEVSASGRKGEICGIEHVEVAQGLFVRGSKFNHSCKPAIHASYVKRHLYVHAAQFLGAYSPLELSYGPEVGNAVKCRRRRWLEQRYFFLCKCDACVQETVHDMYLIAYRCSRSSCDGIVLGPELTNDELELNDKLELTELPQSRCSKCGTEIEDHAFAESANCVQHLERLYHAAVENDECKALGDAAKALEIGKRYLHPFNKHLARMEDMMARLCCIAFRPSSALQHAKASTEILKRVYGSEHIAVAFELVKLASIARLVQPHSPLAMQTLEEASRIFSNHYGLHYRHDFPQLWSLLSGM